MPAENEKKISTTGLYLVVLAIYLVIYASISLRIGRHWDEVLDFDGSAFNTYTAGGRWLTGAFRYLTGAWEPPAVSDFVSGAVVSLLVTLQCRGAGLKQTWREIAFVVLYMGCIQWASMLRYSIMVESVAIGMCCATAAAWLSFKPGWKSAVAAVLLLAVAIGAYQTLALYFGVAWLLLRLLKLRRGQGEYSMQPWWRMACISAGGIAVWYAVRCATLLSVPQEALDYVQNYQTGMTQWDLVLSCAPMTEKAMCIVHYFMVSVYNALGVGPSTYWLFAASILPLVGIIWQALRGSAGWRRWEQCAIALVIWWLPFCLSLLLLSSQGLHAALAAPLAFAGLWLIWLSGAKLERRHVPALCLMAAAIIAAAAYNVYTQAVEEAGLHRNTIALIGEMKERGRACALEAGLPDAPVVVLTELKDKTSPFLGAYPIVMGTGCMDWYCTAYGIKGIHHGSEEERDAHREAYDVMPSWPQKGSVRMDQGSVIIKASR